MNNGMQGRPAVVAWRRHLILATALMTACATTFTAVDQKLLDGLKAEDGKQVEAALAHGAQANVKYADGMRPLGVAVARNDHASAAALLRAGADPNITVQTIAGGTNASTTSGLLSLAEDSKMAAILVKGGADLSRKDAAGETALGRAVVDGNAALVKVLLDAGASPAAAIANNQTPLQFAVSTDNTAVVTALLEGGADPNAEDAEGRTVLHEAATMPSGVTVAVLLKKNASVNARAHDGSTPLMVAAREGYPGPARALFAGGADVNLRDSNGYTAVDLANAKEHQQVAELLKEGGGTATRDAAAAREELAKREHAAEGRDHLRVFTTSLTTDGRNLKIRGRVENPHADAVEGIRYRVWILQGDSKRVLDSFTEERDDTALEPRGSMALRLDVATMYAATEGYFLVEAVPMRLGDREVPEPPHWAKGSLP